MKSIQIDRYGPAEVMVMADVPVPEVTGGELLVRVMYTSVNPLDWKIRNGMLRFMSGRRFPLKLGQDVAGVVEEAGPGTARFAVGDRVFGMLGQRRRGAYAEYAVALESELAQIPEGLGFREAGVVPLAALTAWRALHVNCRLQQGEAVLINGASGGVGTFAVQIAKAAGAKVTGVCSGRNVEFVRALGADEAVDYEKQPVTGLPSRYDIIFDLTGRLSFFVVRRMLKPEGRFISTLPGGLLGVLGLVLSPVAYLLGYEKRAMMVMVKPDGAALGKIAGLIEEGKLRPVVGHEYPLDEIRQAHLLSETGHVRGKIAVRVP